MTGSSPALLSVETTSPARRRPRLSGRPQQLSSSAAGHQAAARGGRCHHHTSLSTLASFVPQPPRTHSTAATACGAQRKAARSTVRLPLSPSDQASLIVRGSTTLRGWRRRVPAPGHPCGIRRCQHRCGQWPQSSSVPQPDAPLEGTCARRGHADTASWQGRGAHSALRLARHRSEGRASLRITVSRREQPACGFLLPPWEAARSQAIAGRGTWWYRNCSAPCVRPL